MWSLSIWSYFMDILIIYLWCCYYSILAYVVNPYPWRWSQSIIGGLCGFIAACHVHCIIHVHWKLCRWPMVTTVPVQHHGMQLHTLLGVQAGDILHCIHMHSRSTLKWYVYVIIKLYYLAMFKIGSHSFYIDIIYLVYSISGTPC